MHDDRWPAAHAARARRAYDFIFSCCCCVVHARAACTRVFVQIYEITRVSISHDNCAFV
jgi:hypothetical protein